MTFLNRQQIRERFAPSDSEITDWLKKNHFKSTRANRALATRKITASNIKKALGRETAGVAPAGNWQVVYGLTHVGGTITFLNINGSNQKYHIVVTLACHEIESIEKLYLDDQEVIFGGGDPTWSTAIRDTKTGASRAAVNKIRMVLNDGAPGNPAIPELMSTCPNRWFSTSKQSGRAHVYIELIWDAVLFPDGRPDISFLVKGKKVYDPRTDTTAWSQNPALIMLDYITNSEYGLGVDIDDVITEEGAAGSFYDAADVCDEDVDLISGGTEKRYTINGSFEIGETHQNYLEEMLTSCDGSIPYADGKWQLFVADYTEPVLTLTEDDIVSDIQVTTRISRRDNFNAIKGTYISPQANYEETDFPAVRNSYYKGLDNNEEVFEDIQLPYTQSSATAQRLAKIQLEKIRQPLTIELTAKLRAYRAKAGENIALTWVPFGWNEKVFYVEECQLVWMGYNDSRAICVKMVLRETAEGVFGWNSGLETRVDLAPNSDLPIPSIVETPSGITLSSGTNQLYIRSDGTVFSRLKVAWTSLSDYFVSSGGTVEVQYRKQGVSDWSTATPVPGDFNFTHILDVQDGETYEVQVRARSAFGAYSDFSSTYTHTVVGKSEAPSRVDGLAGQLGQFGIFLSWNKVPDLDVNTYELRIGSLDDTWEEAQYIDRINATSKQVTLQTSGSYKFLVKAVDTSGNLSTVATELTMAIDVPTAPAVSATIVGSNVILSWTASTGDYEIRDYEIRYGDTFLAAVTEAAIKGTSYQRKVDWSGTRRFWVFANDVASNMGTPSSVDVVIIAPSTPVNTSVEVVDNNVFLRWEAPEAGTLPIETYRVYEGDTFDDAELLGQVTATFSGRFEIISGTYTYWIEAVDTAENAGSPSVVVAIVNQPPDFVLLSDQSIDPDDGSGVNFFIENDELFLAVNSHETWQEHFDNNGWSSPQDQIDDGYPYFLQPSMAYGYWTKVIDYGATIPASLIKATFVVTEISGTSGVTTELSYSADLSSWVTDEASQIFGQNFRYVRVKIIKGTLPAPSGQATGIVGLTYP